MVQNPLLNKYFLFFTDVSSQSLEVVLSQVHLDREFPAAYNSSKLTPVEQK